VVWGLAESRRAKKLRDIPETQNHVQWLSELAPRRVEAEGGRMGGRMEESVFTTALYQSHAKRFLFMWPPFVTTHAADAF